MAAYPVSNGANDLYSKKECGVGGGASQEGNEPALPLARHLLLEHVEDHPSAEEGRGMAMAAAESSAARPTAQPAISAKKTNQRPSRA